MSEMFLIRLNSMDKIIRRVQSHESTMEPRFNEVAGEEPNLSVKSRVHYIENLHIMNLRGNDQNVL